MWNPTVYTLIIWSGREKLSECENSDEICTETVVGWSVMGAGGWMYYGKGEAEIIYGRDLIKFIALRRDTTVNHFPE